MMESKINNIIKIPTSLQTNFFRYWLEFLKPFHNLTNKEMSVASKLLQKRHQLSEAIKDDKILDQVLMSEESRKEIATELKVTRPHLLVLFGGLKRAGFLQDNSINPRYIPRLTGANQFNLLLSFDLND